VRNAVEHITEAAGPRLDTDREALHEASLAWIEAVRRDGATFEGDKNTADLLAMTFMAGWHAGRRRSNQEALAVGDQDAVCAACAVENGLEHRAGCPWCGKDFL
jgi:hypothetical protein